MVSSFKLSFFPTHMKPPLHNPSSIVFLLVFLFISISNTIPTSVGADDDRFTNCSRNSFSCGFISNITYPFWGDNRPDYCGLPDFQLACESNIPNIIIQSLKYRILYLGLTSQLLTVSRDDVSFYSACMTEQYKNNTFDPATFQYVDGVVNVTFLYQCVSTNNTSFQSNIGSTGCYGSDGTYHGTVYYVLGQVYVSDCKSVIMPIQATKTEAFLHQQIDEALHEGFGLKWTVNNEQCNTCAESGGECGNDDGQFVCFCKEGPKKPSCSQVSSGSTLKLGPGLVLAISGGVGGIALISILIIYNFKKHFSKEKRIFFKDRCACHDYNIQSVVENCGSTVPRQYSYSEVKTMTKSFADKLGEGGYGVVYKATLPDCRLVAVKVIRETKATGEEFVNEVASISKTSHVNIVTLLGFCHERNKRALIYEYMSNGSLDNFIYKRGSLNVFCTLEWKRLYQITIGIAQGLEYLHRGCNTRILHLDIKPQNILLDEDFCPKISDFGLAKICQKKESIVSILGTRGTIGFIAPEIFNRAFGGVSHKADVYSYGMLVLEMVGGRKNYDTEGSHTDEMYFPDWIYKDLEQGNHSASSLAITEEDDEMVRKMTLVSLWCIQTNPSDRPTMSKVVEMLEGPLQSLSIAPKPSLQSPTRSRLQFSFGSSDEILPTNSVSA